MCTPFAGGPGDAQGMQAARMINSTGWLWRRGEGIQDQVVTTDLDTLAAAWSVKADDLLTQARELLGDVHDDAAMFVLTAPPIEPGPREARRVFCPALALSRFLGGCDDPRMDVSAGDLGGLLREAVAAHGRMLTSASRMTDSDCRGSSLLPGWSRGHVLTHWARNADGQSRMLLAAMRNKVATQYPGGDAQRDRDIEAGAARPARLILDDAHVATRRLQDAWRGMPPDAWSRPTAARAGPRPAWMSTWARWRETEIHHVDLNTGYTHSQWPAEFVDLLLMRVLPTMAAGWPMRSPFRQKRRTAIRP